MGIYSRWRDSHVAIETMRKKGVGVKFGTEKLLGEGASDWRTEEHSAAVKGAGGINKNTLTFQKIQSQGGKQY